MTTVQLGLVDRVLEMDLDRRILLQNERVPRSDGCIVDRIDKFVDVTPRVRWGKIFIEWSGA